MTYDMVTDERAMTLSNNWFNLDIDSIFLLQPLTISPFYQPFPYCELKRYCLRRIVNHDGKSKLSTQSRRVKSYVTKITIVIKKREGKDFFSMEAMLKKSHFIWWNMSSPSFLSLFLRYSQRLTIHLVWLQFSHLLFFKWLPFISWNEKTECFLGNQVTNRNPCWRVGGADHFSFQLYSTGRTRSDSSWKRFEPRKLMTMVVDKEKVFNGTWRIKWVGSEKLKREKSHTIKKQDEIMVNTKKVELFNRIGTKARKRDRASQDGRGRDVMAPQRWSHHLWWLSPTGTDQNSANHRHNGNDHEKEEGG